MRTRSIKFSFLVILAIFFCVAPLAFASTAGSPAAGEHHEMATGSSAASQGAASAVVPRDATATDHAVATAKEQGHGEAHGGALAPAKLKDLFWRTVNFLALVVLLVKFLGKPISAGLSGRQQQIKEDLEELSIRRDEAEKSYEEFEAKLAGMEREMELVVQKAIAQAQNEKERILADAERVAEDIKRQAEAAVLAELEDAKRTLREEVAEQAAAMAEKLIVSNLTAADQVAITEQYLERVGAVQ